MLYYQSEYRLGRRGGRVNHTFHGYQAFFVIVATLAFSLVFSVIGAAVFLVVLALRAVRFAVLATMALIIAILTAPFRAARWVSRRLESRPRRIVKPAFAIDDLA